MGDALARKHARTPSLDRPPGRPLTSILSSVRPSLLRRYRASTLRKGRKATRRTDGRTLASGGGGDGEEEEEEAAAMINLSFLLKGKWSWPD